MFSKFVAVAVCLLFTAGCTFSLDWFRQLRAENAISNQDYPTALEIFRKIITDNPDSPRALEAARTGARVAHLNAKNHVLAVEFFRDVVLRSPDAEERKSAQQYIAQIEFENLQDYNQAIVEYEKLLRLDNKPDEIFHYRLNLAKSHLRLNNVDQAVVELDILLAQKVPADEAFEARVLKANTLVAAKRLSEAVVAWQDILKDFPEKAKKENVALNLSVCYEELKEYSKAIETLESMREGYVHPEFLNMRIQRLKGRLENRPGAQGLKK